MSEIGCDRLCVGDKWSVVRGSDNEVEIRVGTQDGKVIRGDGIGQSNLFFLDDTRNVQLTNECLPIYRTYY